MSKLVSGLLVTIIVLLFLLSGCATVAPQANLAKAEQVKEKPAPKQNAEPIDRSAKLGSEGPIKVHFSYEPLNFVPLWAQEAYKEREKQSDLSFEFMTRYEHSGWMDLNGNRTKVGPVQVTDISLGLPLGFRLDIWDLRGFKKSTADETDASLVKTGKAWFLGIPLQYEVGLGYWDLKDKFTPSGSKTDYWTVWAEIGPELRLTDNLKLSFYIRPESVEPIRSKGEGDEGGFRVALGFRHEWEAGKFIFPLTLSTNCRFVYDSGLYGGETAWIGRLTIQAFWQISDSWSATLGVDLSQPFASLEDKDGRGSEVISMAGIVYATDWAKLLGVRN